MSDGVGLPSQITKALEPLLARLCDAEVRLRYLEAILRHVDGTIVLDVAARETKVRPYPTPQFEFGEELPPLNPGDQGCDPGGTVELPDTYAINSLLFEIQRSLDDVHEVRANVWALLRSVGLTPP